MKNVKSILLASLAILSLSCSKESIKEDVNPSAPQVNLVPMTFSAASPLTKTAVAENGKSVNWLAEDKIAVMDNIKGDALEFNLTDGAGTSSAKFSGEVSEGSTEFYAFYPYSENLYCMEGDFINTEILADQSSTATNISAGMMVAKADESNNFAFKNVNALVKFTVKAEDNIVHVAFRGKGKEKIAGTFEFTYDGSSIDVDASKLTETEVSVVKNDGVLDGTYYLAVAPVDLSGVEIEIWNSAFEAATLTGGELNLKSGDMLNLGTLAPSFQNEDLTVAQLLDKINAGDDISSYNLVGVVAYSETAGTPFYRGTVMIQDNVDSQNTGVIIFNKDNNTGLYKNTYVVAGNKIRISLGNATIVDENSDYGLQLEGVANTDVIDRISSGNEIVKARATAATLSSYKGQYVVIENASPTITGKLNQASTTYKFNADAEVNVYIKSSAWDGKDVIVDASKTGNLSGFVSYYKGTWQLVPVAEENISDFAVTGPAISDVIPESLSWAAADYGSEKAKTITISGYNLTSAAISASLDNDNFSHTVSVGEDGISATVSVYPVAANASTTDAKTATLTISCGSFSKSISLTQGKAGAVVKTYTLTFPDDNKSNNKVGSYSKSWTAKAGTNSWTITNFNNNNWNWANIRAGSKNGTSVASISTDAAIAESICKLTVVIDAITANYVNSISWVVATDSKFENVKETISVDKSKAGTIASKVTIPTPNCYYKLVVDCQKSTSKIGNGFVQISKLEYTNAE